MAFELLAALNTEWYPLSWWRGAKNTPLKHQEGDEGTPLKDSKLGALLIMYSLLRDAYVSKLIYFAKEKLKGIFSINNCILYSARKKRKQQKKWKLCIYYEETQQTSNWKLSSKMNITNSLIKTTKHCNYSSSSPPSPTHKVCVCERERQGETYMHM